MTGDTKIGIVFTLLAVILLAAGLFFMIRDTECSDLCHPVKVEHCGRNFAVCADYDWVVLCQLFGRMIDLPDGWPKFCRDFKQLIDGTDFQRKPNTNAHDALQDALWLKAEFDRFQEEKV